MASVNRQLEIIASQYKSNTWNSKVFKQCLGIICQLGYLLKSGIGSEMSHFPNFSPSDL
jgi:hypothetical protein